MKYLYLRPAWGREGSELIDTVSSIQLVISVHIPDAASSGARHRVRRGSRSWPRASTSHGCLESLPSRSVFKIENRGGSREIRNIVNVCSVMYLPVESGLENRTITTYLCFAVRCGFIIAIKITANHGKTRKTITLRNQPIPHRPCFNTATVCKDEVTCKKSHLWTYRPIFVN